MHLKSYYSNFPSPVKTYRLRIRHFRSKVVTIRRFQRFKRYKRLRSSFLRFGLRSKWPQLKSLRLLRQLKKSHELFLKIRVKPGYKRLIVKKLPNSSLFQHRLWRHQLVPVRLHPGISFMTIRRLKYKVYSQKPTKLKKFRLRRHFFGNLSPKRYLFLTKVCFFHNNIRLILDSRFAHQRQLYSMGFFPEFARRKKLKRGYVAGLDLCLYFYRVVFGSFKIRSFNVKSSGGFGARKGFFNGLRKLKTVTVNRSRIFLTNLSDMTVYAHNGTKRYLKRRL